MQKSIGWVTRHALVFLLIIVALFMHQYLSKEWESASVIGARLESLQSVSDQTPGYQRELINQTNARLSASRADSIAELDRKIAASEMQRRGLISARPRNANVALRFVTAGTDAVLEDQRREMQIAMLTHQVDSLRAFRSVASVNRQSFDLNARRLILERARNHHQRLCVKTKAKIKEFEERWVGYRVWNHSELEQLDSKSKFECGTSDKAQRSIAQIDRAEKAIESSKAGAWSKLSATSLALRTQIAKDQTLVRGSIGGRARAWAERVNLGGKASAAALILLGIILMPFAIRTFLYYVVAPIAERRPSIRIRLPATASRSSIPSGERSQVSIGIRLQRDEELLVRQGFLQSTSVIDHKQSQWFIDWRYPLTSLAAGLTFLTRIRGSQAQATTVSAVNNPLAEVAELALPEGTSCVIHPRALVAVVLHIGRPLKITSHWRLNSLNAWLTLQLRFLVFHGPSRIILNGSRGLRIEKAERGRIFGQDQLVGFSSDLAYSVTRTETFLPYLFGYECLLKDTVADGSGMLIVEESPMAGRGRSGAKRGLEGAVDAALKVVGI